MTTEAPAKPLPLPDEDSRPFYDGAAAGKLMLMRCIACGTTRLPSRHHCDECLSPEFEWFEASGRGVVRTFGVMHQRYHPGFASEIPYVVAIIELEEGPRMPANIVDTAPADVRVGMPVLVAWEPHEDVTIPRFRPIPGAA
jgi:uncharacterized OB-fold protein